MGNKTSSNKRGETTSLTDSPTLKSRSRKPAKRALSFGDKPRKAWTRDNGHQSLAAAGTEVE